MRKEIVSAQEVHRYRGGWKGKWVSLRSLAKYLKRTPVQVWRNFFYSPDWDLKYPIPSPTHQQVTSMFGRVWNVQPDGQVVRLKRKKKGKRKTAFPTGSFAFGNRSVFFARLKTGDLLVSAAWADSVFRSLGAGYSGFGASHFQDPAAIATLDAALKTR